MQLSLFGLLLLPQPLNSSEQDTRANLEFFSNFGFFVYNLERCICSHFWFSQNYPTSSYAPAQFKMIFYRVKSSLIHKSLPSLEFHQTCFEHQLQLHFPKQTFQFQSCHVLMHNANYQNYNSEPCAQKIHYKCACEYFLLFLHILHFPLKHIGVIN